jgi:hypothetical protein
MGHKVRAFVGARPILELIQRRFEQSRVVDLEQLLALLPLTGELYNAIPDDVTGPAETGFVMLKPKVVELLKEISTYGMIGYFETDYFGGTGRQGAILARLDKITFGPQVGPNSINEMLEQLGARRKGEHDAYDAVGLGLYRDNDSWIEQSPVKSTIETVTMTGKFISWFHGMGKK